MTSPSPTLLGYKGIVSQTSGYVYAPYMPIYATSPVSVDQMNSINVRIVPKFTDEVAWYGGVYFAPGMHKALGMVYNCYSREGEGIGGLNWGAKVNVHVSDNDLEYFTRKKILCIEGTSFDGRDPFYRATPLGVKVLEEYGFLYKLSGGE
jgi:hypothetical protein